MCQRIEDLSSRFSRQFNESSQMSHCFASCFRSSSSLLVQWERKSVHCCNNKFWHSMPGTTLTLFLQRCFALTRFALSLAIDLACLSLIIATHSCICRLCRSLCLSERALAWILSFAYALIVLEFAVKFNTICLHLELFQLFNQCYRLFHCCPGLCHGIVDNDIACLLFFSQLLE